ncbi:hypothetical protein, partial [Natranaeroarchaeum aerophilus]
MNELPFNRRDLLKLSGSTLFAAGAVPQAVQAQKTTISPGEEISGTINSSDDRDEFEMSVSQGDVIEIESEKEARNRTRFNMSLPRGGGGNFGGSVGEETYRTRRTIEETGTLEFSIYTFDEDVDDPQPYSFEITRYEGLDQWPA